MVLVCVRTGEIANCSRANFLSPSRHHSTRTAPGGACLINIMGQNSHAQRSGWWCWWAAQQVRFYRRAIEAWGEMAAPPPLCGWCIPLPPVELPARNPALDQPGTGRGPLQEVFEKRITQNRNSCSKSFANVASQSSIMMIYNTDHNPLLT